MSTTAPTKSIGDCIADLETSVNAELGDTARFKVGEERSWDGKGGTTHRAWLHVGSHDWRLDDINPREHGITTRVLDVIGCHAAELAEAAGRVCKKLGVKYEH